MNTSTQLPSQAVTQDKDLAQQARPGHGIPSQDTNPAAQVPMTPGESEREAKSVLTGGGVVGGAALGATVGAVVGGPVGVVVGGTLGAVAGALGGVAAGTVMSPSPEEPTRTEPVSPANPSAPSGLPPSIGGVKPR